jgi:hypothetical protein
VISDPLIEEVGRALEDSLREFTSQTSFAWRLEMTRESDIEFPDWKRFVLRIHVSLGNFDEKLKVWGELDRTVRQKLLELAEGHPEEAKRILQFNKLLYLRMDMA